MNISEFFVRDFREAAPYINYLRGKTLVIGVASSLLENGTLRALSADLNLLTSLGVRLVLVHGSRSQINELENIRGHHPQYHNGRRITDSDTLMLAKQVSGVLRCDIEAALATSISQTSQRSKPLNIASGNFISARPMGVIDGIDMGYTGRIRKVNTEAISERLDNGALVLISPIGHALSGKTFNLSMGDIAEATAIALKAEKLIYLVEQDGILDSDGQVIPNLNASEAQALLQQQGLDSKQSRLLQSAIHAVENQVVRTHILSGRQDGSLLRELFTRNGVGTSIAHNPFINIRQAHSRDIPNIIALIRPLEDQGVLLRRSQEYLENHIKGFSILEHDQQIYGCVALKTFPSAPHCGELACLVVSPQAQDGGYGERLLEHLLQQARAQGIHTLFALSTHTGEWFIERGFRPANVNELPIERLAEYNDSGRASKVFVYSLE